jgi:hypothetical protein
VARNVLPADPVSGRRRTHHQPDRFGDQFTFEAPFSALFKMSIYTNSGFCVASSILIPRDAARCRAMPRDAARCRAMPRDAARCRAMPRDAARPDWK